MVFAGDFAALGLFAGGFRRLSLLSLPLGGKVAPKGPDEGAGFATISCYAGRISPPAGGEFLCPWRQRNQNAPGDAADGLRLRLGP